MKEKRHVPYTELGLLTANFGHPDRTEDIGNLLNKPPLAHKETNQLLATLVYQQAAMIQILRDELQGLRQDVAALRRDLRSAQTRKASAREQAAKAEEKAAKARERAAIAEAYAKTAQPPVIIQMGDNLEELEARFNRTF